MSEQPSTQWTRDILRIAVDRDGSMNPYAVTIVLLEIIDRLESLERERAEERRLLERSVPS